MQKLKISKTFRFSGSPMLWPQKPESLLSKPGPTHTQVLGLGFFPGFPGFKEFSAIDHHLVTMYLISLYNFRNWPHCALLSWPNLTTLHCTLNDCYVNSDLFVCKKNRNGFPNSSIDLISSPVRALGCTSSICNFMYNLLKSFLKEHSSFHEPAFLQNIHTIAWKLRKYHVYEK